MERLYIVKVPENANSSAFGDEQENFRLIIITISIQPEL